MLIKYFNQRGNIIDKSINNVIKPKYKIEILDRSMVLNFLETDGINVNEIQMIRYYDENNEGWRLFEETTFIKVDQMNFELQLIVKISDSYFSLERGLIKNFQELNQRIIYQEKKFEEIESIVRSASSYSLSERDYFNTFSKISKNINISTTQPNNFYNSMSGIYNDNRVDLAYVFTNPLFKVENNNETRFYWEEYLDYEKEIENIIDIIKTTNKKFLATIQVGTVANLINIISMKPKTLLISCEVSVEEIAGKDNYYLHLEDNDGCLDKIHIEDFKNLIKFEDNMIELVCIYTFHSELVGEIFKFLNIPAIITVHTNRYELDLSSQKFTKYLYESLIFGNTIKSSFNRAINEIKNEFGKNELIKRCCCFHSHKPYCIFNKKFSIQREEAHLMHIKSCKCKEDIDHHIHNINCAWAKKFLSKMNISEILHGDKIKVCCCSPEIAHYTPLDKFKLILGSNYENLVLFSSLANGSLDILNKNICLNLKFSSDLKIPLIGRNKELTDIISIIKTSGIKNRLLTICGEIGIGKEAFTKCLGVYLFERKHFEAGIHFIQSNSYTLNDRELINLTCSSLSLNIHFDDVNELFKFIDSDMLIIFKFPIKEKDENLESHKAFLEKILKTTHHLKFIVISPIYLNSQYEKQISLPNLSNYQLAKMLNRLAGDYLPSNLRNNIDIIEKDELIKITEGIPRGIIDIAGFLQDNLSKNEIIERFKRLNPKKDSPLSKEKISDKITDIINEEDPDERKKIYGLLYFLVLSPNGLLQRDLIKIYSNKQTLTLILSIINRFTQMNLLINQREIKELSTYAYYLKKDDKDLIESIVEKNLSDEERLGLNYNLIHYYSIACRKVVTNLNQDVCIDFSAFQNYGMWFSLNLKEEFAGEIEKIILSKYTHEKVYNPVKYYLHIEESIKILLKSEILGKFFAFYKNKHLPLELKESIEQLSICIPSILKAIGKLTDCMIMIKNFLEITEKFEFKLARGRLMIFSMSLYPALSNPNMVMYGSSSNEFSFNTQFTQILKIFNGSIFYEGIAESYFCKAVTIFEIEKQKNHSNIPEELLNEIIEDLQTSLAIYAPRNFYSEEDLELSHNSTLGYARVCYVLSDYLTNCGNSEDIYLNLLDTARFIFENKNKIIPYLKCMLMSSKWHINKKNFSDAYSIAEKVASLAKHYYRTIIEDEANHILSTIKDLIQLQSQNLFVFIEAHQLVFGINFINTRHTENETSIKHSISYNSHQDIGYVMEEAVEPIVTYPNLFRNKLLQSISNINKESVFKFEVMSKHTLTEILDKGGKFLHLSSDFFTSKSKNSLFVEGNYGESVEITFRSLEKILKSSNCLFEIVVISIPQSRKLGEIFVKLGVKHVICFDFSDITNSTLNKFSYIPIRNLLNDFSISLLTNLLKQETIQAAFDISKRDYIFKFKTAIEDNINSYTNHSFIDADISPILLPESSNHQIIISCKTKNPEGIVKDSTKFCNQIEDTNESLQAMIGRKKEIYFSIKILVGNTNLNIYGDSGIGRTTLVKEISNYLGIRQKFKDGIFYLDLNEIDSVESLKEMLVNNQISSIIEKNKTEKHCDCEDKKMLLIFDSCDNIIKRNESQFFILIFTLGFDRFNSIIFLLVSNRKLINPNFLHSEYLRLDPLNKLESAFLFLTSCERRLEKGEIDAECEDEVDFIEYVSESKRMNACKGYPAYIKKLAKLAIGSKLNRIDYKQFLPNKFYKKLTDYELDDNYRFQLVINKKTSNASQHKLSLQNQRKSLNENKRNKTSTRKISNIDSVDEIKHDYKLNRKNNYMKKVNSRNNKVPKINKFNNSPESTSDHNDEEYSSLKNGVDFDVDSQSISQMGNSNTSEKESLSRFNEYSIQENEIDLQHGKNNSSIKNLIDQQDSINYQLANTYIKSKLKNKCLSEKDNDIPFDLQKISADCLESCNREKTQNNLINKCSEFRELIGTLNHNNSNNSFNKAEQFQSDRCNSKKNSEKNSQLIFNFNVNNFVFGNLNKLTEIKMKNSNLSVDERIGFNFECGDSSKILF